MAPASGTSYTRRWSSLLESDFVTRCLLQWLFTTYRSVVAVLRVLKCGHPPLSMATSRPVMMSLKAFAPILASTLGTTPAAIYERQRALIRAGALPTPVGRGRGNGLPATAETAALMLMAFMVTDNLSDTDGRVQKLAEARFSRHPERGPKLMRA